MDVDDGAVHDLSAVGAEGSITSGPLGAESVEDSSDANLRVACLALTGHQGDSPLLGIYARDLGLPVLENLRPSFGKVVGHLFDQFLVHAAHCFFPSLGILELFRELRVRPSHI